jgi:hypothetical protein
LVFPAFGTVIQHQATDLKWLIINFVVRCNAGAALDRATIWSRFGVIAAEIG